MLVIAFVGLSCNHKVLYTKSAFKYSGQTKPTQFKTWVISFCFRFPCPLQQHLHQDKYALPLLSIFYQRKQSYTSLEAHHSYHYSAELMINQALTSHHSCSHLGLAAMATHQDHQNQPLATHLTLLCN